MQKQETIMTPVFLFYHYERLYINNRMNQSKIENNSSIHFFA
jgi:hypothetical protein